MFKNKSIAMRFTSIFILTATLIGINVSAVEKIPNFGTMKASDTRLSYFVTFTNGKSNKIRLSEKDTIMLTKLFNTNNYTDIYIDNKFQNRIMNPFIEIHAKGNRIISLYYTSSGFVFIDKKKKYYVDQPYYPYFFGHCQGEYSGKSISNSETDKKYIPMTFTVNNFLLGLKKIGCDYKFIRKDNTEGFVYPISTISMDDEEVSIIPFKDEIDMELYAMKFAVIEKAGCWNAPPHAFKKGNIIVSYYGDNDNIIKYIEKVIGKQYAGYEVN